jgi:iron(III) transport system substrate-binding protein
MRRVVAVITALALTLVACSPPLAATPTAAPTAAPAAPAAPAAAATGADPLTSVVAKYYEPAKKEAKLVVYGTGTDTLFNPIKDAFQKRFPGIEVQGVDQRGRESREKVIAEQQSKNYVVDVVASGTDTQAALLQGGYVEPYQAAELAEALPDFVQPNQPYSPRTVTIFTMAINTQLVPADQEPKVWNDILDPKW